MVRVGAEMVFSLKDITITDDDIDKIIAKGEEATTELDTKMKKFMKDAIKFKVDETSEYYDFDDDKKFLFDLILPAELYDFDDDKVEYLATQLLYVDIVELAVDGGFFVDINLFKANKHNAIEIARNHKSVVGTFKDDSEITAKEGLADDDANLVIKLKFLTYKFLYGELVERAKEKEEKEAKKRQCLADEFTKVLQTCKAIEEDSLRREIFEEYIAHLQEKAKEKERKREEKRYMYFFHNYDWVFNDCGNEFFCEVDDEYFHGDFNLCGLSSQVPYYDYALDLILHIESSHGDIFTEEQNELVESAAEMLYASMFRLPFLYFCGFNVVSTLNHYRKAFQLCFEW
ncbi:hypothetical protein K2173_018951 [Erythroxylum novogranatense]|uniref:Casein kinase II subunit beta n=1 Tax=Erythroxylum novogranatense TaxID=1862640 RepID=A0AAV8SSV8_9ROSI|nr:hypothetical protein K2173_018951 [Erythroxylum novogranatense]